MASFKKATCFYATTEEVAGWLTGWQSCYGLHAVVGRVFPSPALLRETTWDSLEVVAQIVNQYATICFGLTPLESHVTSINQVPGMNPDCLVIHFPKQSSDALGYGAISSAAKDAESLRVWNAILKDFVKKTKSGAWYIVPGRTKKTPEPEVRYSPGAEQLFQEGIRLLGGGKTVVAALGSVKREPPG